MDQATYQVPPGFVWPTVERSGRVPLWALVPCPYQPRKSFDEEELDELAVTLDPEHGGMQREIATVRELTPEELIRYKPARYMIMSGERRFRSAKRAGLQELEIRVKKYESVAAQKLDMFMLNENRVGLSDIENADYLADLVVEFDWGTLDEIAKGVGKSTSWVSQHIALTKLTDKVKALMSPELPEAARLKRNVGVFLSRLSDAIQDDFAERMPKGDRVTASQQISWMREQLKGTGDEPVRNKFRPSTVRRVIIYFGNQVERRTSELLETPGLEGVFANAQPAQVDEVLNKLLDAQSKFEDLIEKLKSWAPKPASTVAHQPAPVVSRPASAPAPTPKPTERLPTGVHNSSAAPAPAKRAKQEKTITYLGPTGRKLTDKVNQTLYLELMDSNRLGFQVDGKERPAWMPTREAAVEDWEKFCD